MRRTVRIGLLTGWCFMARAAGSVPRPVCSARARARRWCQQLTLAEPTLLRVPAAPVWCAVQLAALPGGGDDDSFQELLLTEGFSLQDRIDELEQKHADLLRNIAR